MSDTQKVIQTVETVAEAIDPGVTGKALIASKTPWGVLAAYGLTFLGAHFGLGLDADTTAVLAGVAVLVGSYAMRYITSKPITGLLSRL
jgi:hypothetical protein